MPFQAPPRRYRGTPLRRVLPATTRLHRVHRRIREATAFSPVVADTLFGGGRFDPTDGEEHAYFYASLTERTALAEVLLRGLPFNDRGTRVIPRAAVKGRRLSGVDVTEDLSLLALTTTAELAAVGQDEWLVQAEPRDYGQTRGWARWLREQAPWAQGLIWSSRRDLGRHTMVLFGDRCLPDILKPAPLPPVDLDDGPGATWLNDTLADFRASVLPPRGSGRA